MNFDYDPGLVLLSILIATVAAYIGFHLAARLLTATGLRRKLLLATAAIAIGGGIWSMHFVAMLAVALPVFVSYDLLATLVSALVAILATGWALAIAAHDPKSTLRTLGGGVFMGFGIVSMHYLGMTAIRGDCVVSHRPTFVAASILVAIITATLAIWLLFRPQGRFHKIAAAFALGLAVSGMHYTGMAGARFLPLGGTVELAAPSLSEPLLAIVVAIVTFLIFAFSMLAALPDMARPAMATNGPSAAFLYESKRRADGAAGRRVQGASGSQPVFEAPPADEPAPASGMIMAAPEPPDPIVAPEPLSVPEPLRRIPVVRNRTTMLLDPDDIVAIDANAHYTTVHGPEGSYFCSLSVSELEARLDPARFLRVHRSHIVNIKHAMGFMRRNDHGILLLLDDEARREVPVSRGKLPKLREALGI